MVAPAGSLGSAPATNFDPDNHSQNVYFSGPDGSLREISWTPSAGWDAMSVITSPGLLSAPAPTVVPAPPAGTGSVPLTPTRTKQRRKLAVKIVMKWHWNHGHTRLVWVKIGRAPRRAALSISCRGRGCPRAQAPRELRHASPPTPDPDAARSTGRATGSLISLTAPSWKPERARITIRNGRQPSLQLL